MKKTVGAYILDCLKKLGIKDLFGVPGDYNLIFLDDVMKDKGIRWIGNTNELNAGYAADAYAKIHGISALATTGGVGELSAINAIGGAYAENVPIIHIVGHPSLQAQQFKHFIHHFLEEGTRFTHPHQEIAGKVSQMTGVVTRYNATTEVPRLIQAALETKKPVTMYVPSDESSQLIEATAFHAKYPPSDKKHLDSLIEEMKKALKGAKKPLLIVDLFASRFSLKKQVRKLVSHLQIPAATTLFGRGTLDETDKHFLGMYVGSNSEKSIENAVKEADTIIVIGGWHYCDYNTGYFSDDFRKAKRVFQLQPNYAIVDGSYKQGLWLPDVVGAMQKKIPALKKMALKSAVKPARKSATPSKGKLTQASFWKEVNPLVADQDAIGVFEVGTAIWASTTMELAPNTDFVGSYGYASIGYATPAVLGTALADTKRRTFAFIGDGSFQLTAQAISSMLRHQLKPVIFLLNNDGYTIERVIHGPKEPYNDVHMWDYCAFAKSLTLDKNQVYTARAKTIEELRKELKSLPKNKLVFIEVYLEKMDAPKALTDMFEHPPKVSLYT